MVRFVNVLRLLCFPLLWLGFIQLVFGVLSITVFQDGVAKIFLGSGAALFLLSAFLWLRTHSRKLNSISLQDGLVFAVLTWLVAGFSGAIPIQLVTDVSWTDATFESISALTTTGATILVGLDDMPRSFLLYRQFLQWTGGLGVVIFVVAVLPMLNVGGMRLLMAETPGPVKNDKVAPRIRDAARYLWLVYITITLACAFSYWLTGMSVYDAFAHSFTTVSTGGFSTHDASMGFFSSTAVLWVANIFMILGAISFALHFTVVKRREWGGYWANEETRVLVLLVLFFGLVTTAVLYFHDVYGSLYESLSHSFFHIISFMTSTGYGATDLGMWPTMMPLILVFVSYLGGCAGSTAGGNKIVRDIIAFKIIRKQIFSLVHPHGAKRVRYQGEVVDYDVLNAVMAFLVLSAFTTLFFTVLMTATGLDFWSAFTAVSACINVLGPGFGEVSSNFIGVSDTGIWLLNIAMLLGRLEYFTIITLLMPAFWRG